ncbi:MAG: HEAT repeat domain-containing protein, partial [Planctomycetota bacterium]
ERSASFTGHNVGLPLALVLDGRVLSTPQIRDTLRDSVQITLGTHATYVELRAEAERLRAALDSPPEAHLAVALVAAIEAPGEGAPFDVVVPLARDETAVTLAARNRQGRTSTRYERRFLRRPNVEMDLDPDAGALLAGLALGLDLEEEAVTRLRPLGRDAVQALAPVAEEETDPARAKAAIRLLGRVDPGSRLAWQALTAAARREEAPLRREAAEALGGFSASPPPLPALALQTLRTLLEDSDPDVRVAAARSIKGYGTRAGASIPALLRARVETPGPEGRAIGGQLSALVLQEPDLRDALVRATRDPDARIRLEAVMELAYVPGDAPRKALLERLGDDDALVRAAALEVLAVPVMQDGPGSMEGAPPPIPAERLLPLLEDPTPRVRALAAALLAQDPEQARVHAGALRALLDDPDESVRCAVAGALEGAGLADARTQALGEPCRRTRERLQREAATADAGNGDR